MHTHAVVSVGSQRAKPRRLSIHTQRERERERERERDRHTYTVFLLIFMFFILTRCARNTNRRHWTYIYL